MRLDLCYSKGRLYQRKYPGGPVRAQKTVAHFDVPNKTGILDDDMAGWLVPGDIVLALGMVSYEESGIGEHYGRWIQFYSLSHQRPIWLREGWFTRDFETVT